MPVLDPQRLIEERVAAIRKYHTDSGVVRAEVDVSGGIDSAVVLMLVSRAIGPENVTACYQSINSSPGSRARAREVATAAGVRLIEIDLSDMFQALVVEMKLAIYKSGRFTPTADRLPSVDGEQLLREVSDRIATDPTILGSIRSCLRAPVGRGFNRMMGGGIRHGTGNEDEDRVARFFQKGGDGEVDTNPIEFFSKGEVYQIAIALGVPRSILTANPSPDLWGVGDDGPKGHTDEDEYDSYFRYPAREHGMLWYSYVDPDTGLYKNVGLLERINRVLDVRFPWGKSIEDVLFDLREPNYPIIHVAIDQAGFSLGEDALFILKQARRIERATRHKACPHIPTLGTRRELVEAGILTNILPL